MCLTLEKKHYSAFVACDALPKLLEERDISELYMVGINTDYCVF